MSELSRNIHRDMNKLHGRPTWRFNKDKKSSGLYSPALGPPALGEGSDRKMMQKLLNNRCDDSMSCGFS